MPENIFEKVRSWGVPAMVRPISEISRTSIVGVVEAVRNRVLDWALELERKGVRGYGMSFSAEERQLARDVNPQIHFRGNITNFSGVIMTSVGAASTGATQSRMTGLDSNAVNSIISELRKGANELTGEDADVLSAAADTVEHAAMEPGQHGGKLRRR